MAWHKERALECIKSRRSRYRSGKAGGLDKHLTHSMRIASTGDSGTASFGYELHLLSTLMLTTISPVVWPYHFLP